MEENIKNIKFQISDELIEHGNAQKELLAITGKFKNKETLIGADLKDLKKKRT